MPQVTNLPDARSGCIGQVAETQDELVDAAVALGDRYTKTFGVAHAARVPQARERWWSARRSRQR